MEMCTHGMAWDLLYVPQMSKHQTVQELATEAHDMEVTIANHCDNSFSVAESKKDSAKFRKNAKFSTSSTKEAITTSKVELVRIAGEPNLEEKRDAPFKTR